MSKQIDERVVSMQFDNAHFEKNVSNTMSTLDKLKQKLRLDGASKGLENVNAAAGKVNMSGLGNSVEAVRLKFSALEVMGVTALVNITNQAVNAGKRIVSALTIQPITTGFNEYELKMNSVQTIMASTGESIDTVNGYLEELNKYSDQTIYSFSDMTQNIGKFTNAGVKLEDAVLAIKGISNEAAVSGANAAEASRAMYNFAQALSAGYVKLIDWKSIENANMATVEFKEQLIEAALAMGTITEAGDGMYKTLEGNVFNATKNFNEYLQDQWMTTDVLVGTLKNYADENTEIGKKAYAAAQDIKTFTMMMDTLKESAQSGWAQTWEILFGDLEAAKVLWTGLAKVIGAPIEKMSELRNGILDGALGKGFEHLMKPFEGVKKTIRGIKEPIDDITKSLEEYNAVVKEVISGDWGVTEKRWSALTEAGYDWKTVQNMVNEELGCSVRYTTDFAIAQGEAAKAGGEVDKFNNKYIATLSKKSDAELEALGLTKEQIDAIKELRKQADKLGMSVDDFIANIDNIDGRWLLIESLKNAGKAIADIFNSIKTAWQEVFPPKTIEERSAGLYNLIAALYKFSNTLKVSDETADKIRRTFKGLFAILDLITSFVGGGVKLAFKLLTSVLSYFNMDILDLTALVGDALVKFHDWVESTFSLSKVLGVVIPFLVECVKAVGDWIKAFKQLPAVQTAIQKVKDAIAGLKEMDFKEIGKNIIDGLVNGLGDGARKVVEKIIEIGSNIITRICEVLGIHSPSTVFFAIGGFILAGLVAGLTAGIPDIREVFTTIGSKCVEFIQGIDLGTVLAVALSIGVIAAVKKFTSILEKFAAPFKGLGDMLGGLGSMFKDLGKGMKSFLKGKGLEAKSNALLNMAKAIGILVAAVIALTFVDSTKLKPALITIGILAGIMAGLLILSGQLQKCKFDFSLGKASLFILAIGATMLLLAFTLKQLSGIAAEDTGKVVELFAWAIVGLIGVVWAFGALAAYGADGSIDKAGDVTLKIGAALILMALTMKVLAGINPDGFNQALIGIGAFVGLVLLLTLIGMIPSKGIDNIGKTMLQIAGSILILTIVAKLIAGMEWNEMIKAGVGILALVGVIGLLVLITTFGGTTVFENTGKTLLAIAGAMLILTIVAKIIASMTWGDMARAAVGLLGLVGVVALLVLIVKMVEKDAPKIALTLLALSVSIGILAAVAIILSLISIEGLANGVIAIGLLSVCMAFMITATECARDCKGNIMAMAVAIGVMAAAVAVLSFIKPKKLLGAVAAMSVMMAMFAVMTLASKFATGSIGTLIVLTVVIAAMAAVIYILAKLPVENVMGVAVAMSALLLSMSVSLLLLGIIGPMAIVGAVAIGVLTIVLFGLAAVFRKMADIPAESALVSSRAISTLLLSMSVSLLLLGIIGPLALVGVVALGLLTIIIAGLAFILYKMEELDTAKALINVMLITTLINGLSKACVILAVAGLGGPAAIFGVEALVLLVAAIGTLITAIGALVTKFPQLEQFLDTGIPILEKIGYALGSFFGNIVGGFASGVTAGLPQIGKHLSEFMLNAMPFFVGMSAVDSRMAEGVKAVASAILTLTGASILEGIASFLGCDVSFAELGEGLVPFGESVAEFAGVFEGVNLDNLYIAADATKALGEVAANLPNSGGWLGKIMGENDWATFGDGLVEFGIAMCMFGTTVANLNSDAILASIEPTKALSEVAENLPNSGGALGLLAGENDWATFGDGLVEFGIAMCMFSTTVGGLNSANIENAVGATKALSKVAESLPNSGGVAGFFAGENDWTTFGAGLAEFGTALKDFANEVDGIDTENFGAVLDEVDKIAKLPDKLESFTSDFGDIGADAVEEFIDAFDDAGKDAKKAGEDLAKKVKKGAKSEKKKLTDAWKSLSKSSVNTVKDYKSKFYNAGVDLVTGLANGIDESTYKVEGKSTNLAKTALQTVKKVLNINSPSKEFREVGYSVPEGFAMGIDRLAGMVTGSSTDMANSAISTVKDSIARIGRAISSDVDTQPTIRPVLDLSAVSAGAGAINGMFNANPSIGVSSNLRAISSSMSRRQNGTYDVVSAIDSLRRDLGNLGGNSYNINGINYSEGSEVGEALKTIVRAARVERRI